MSTQYQINVQYKGMNGYLIAGTYKSQARAEAILRFMRLIGKCEILDAKVLPVNYRNKKEKRRYFLNMLKKREAQQQQHGGRDTSYDYLYDRDDDFYDPSRDM